MSDLTQQGIIALKSGNRDLAKRLLRQASQVNPNDLQAWLWLSGAVETESEQVECLKQVLRLEPNHPLATRGLAEIEARKFAPPAPTPAPAAPPQPATPQAAPAPKPPASPFDDLRSSYSYEDTSPEPEPEPAPPSNPFTRFKSQSTPAESPTAQKPAAPGRKPVQKAKKPARFNRTQMIILGGVGGLVVLTLCMGIFLITKLSGGSSDLPAAPAALVENGTATLTPTRTEIPSATPTLTLTPRPTKTATPTETLVPLGPTAKAQSERIEKEVADLRGLPIQTQVPFLIITRNRTDQLLRDRYVNDEMKTQLVDQQRALSVLGLIKPTYDLVNATLNHLVDGIGGFFIPETKEIFVLGLRFGGIEHYIYSHEFDHALVDQNFDLARERENRQCGVYAESDACKALTGLVEGDAEVLMEKWWKQYAGPQDYRDILMYRPPALALPEQSPPPFLSEDVNFPYEKGKAFVKYLYTLGNWDKVNKAYLNPPTTTEQILHPKLYITGEGAIPVEPAPVDIALGPDWRTIQSSVLGEWGTYLLLGYNADVNAQVDLNDATIAAAGWGGDHYQVYYNAGQDTTALVAKWVWDSDKDSLEFYNALRQQLNERFRGSVLEHAGECWQNGGQNACIFRKGTSTLWLMAPDIETLDMMLALHPDMQP